MTPVMCGSAYKNKGVQLLLDAVTYYLPNPKDVVNEGHDQNKGEEKVIIESDSTKPFVGLAFKLQQDKYGQLTYFRVYQGTIAAGDTIYNVSNEKRKVRVPRMFRMHSDDREEIPVAEAGDIVAFYGVEASSGETFTDGKVQVTLTSMHVPAAVISLAVAPKDRVGRDELLEGAQPLHEGRPDVPRAPGRGVAADHHQRDGRAAPRHLHGAHAARVQLRRRRGQAAGRVPRDDHARSEIAYTHKKQTGGSGQFARINGYIEPLPEDAVEAYEFVDDIVGGSIPREYIPACDKGFKEGVAQGQPHRVPRRRHPHRHQRRQFHPVDSSEMAFKTAALMGFREAYARREADHPRAHHEGGDRRPIEFQGSVVGQVNQRRGMILDTVSGDNVTRHVRGAPQHDVRLLDRPPLRDAGEGELHDGVRQVRPRPAPGAGRDGEEVQREARGRGEEVARAGDARSRSQGARAARSVLHVDSPVAPGAVAAVWPGAPGALHTRQTFSSPLPVTRNAPRSGTSLPQSSDCTRASGKDGRRRRSR